MNASPHECLRRASPGHASRRHYQYDTIVCQAGLSAETMKFVGEIRTPATNVSAGIVVSPINFPGIARQPTASRGTDCTSDQNPETKAMTTISYSRPIDRTVRIEMDNTSIEADWTMPIDARGAVIFVQGCGNSRFSRRNREVARKLYDQGLATLLPDLFTPDEEREDMLTASLRFDVNRLVERVLGVTRWLSREQEAASLPVGYFATGIGAGAALLAAALRKDLVAAVVSHSGRPDLAGIALNKVKAPTLLIAGSADSEVLALNRWAYWRMECERHLELVPGSSHSFEEGGATEAATVLAAEWFDLHLAAQHAAF